MRVRVLFFGVLKEIFPGDRQTLDLPDGATVETLLGHYRHRAPAHRALWPALAIAVNQEYAPHSQALREGDEVALLPPVSGGRETPTAAARAALVRQPIDSASIASGLKRGEDGAIVVFEGIVRNHTRGRRTLYLDYEAYEEMALRRMNNLAMEAIAAYGVREVSLVHRLGRLQVGETSILIAVASAHRAPAFDACRRLIDTIKTTVPIWKKEYFDDGAVWAAGEPFPAAIVPEGGP